MPSKKRKYNARFPAGRIKKIMQTDEEVGKVAQAVPIIISRTLELFVESLLSKALQVTASRNAKTLSPSHVKQCILAESRFDFLRDLVKNIPDVSAAEEKEMQMSAESSPNSSRFSDTSVPPRRIVREDSNSSSSCDVRVVTRETLVRALSAEVEQKPRIETITTNATLPATVATEAAIDLTKKREERPQRTANFYQETLVEPVHRSVIRVNPTYTCPQPSTSTYASLTPVEPLNRVETPKDVKPQFYVDLRQNNNISMTPPRTPVTPILNIDFSKNISNPEIKVLDAVGSAGVSTLAKEKVREKVHRQNSKSKHEHVRDSKPPSAHAQPLDIDRINSGNLQIDEDYDT